MLYNQAKDIAVKICYQLHPFCTKINIAGGVRRKKPEPHDIEIVCLPNKIEIASTDLFGFDEKSFAINPKFIEVVNSLGNIIKGKPTGKMMQIELPEGVMLDLFIPAEADYYRQFAIRTGSADYAHKVIATAWLKKGWCGSDLGLRLKKDCIEMKGPDGKSKWKCVNKNGEIPPVWESEEHFFQWLRIDMVRAEEREV